MPRLQQKQFTVIIDTNSYIFLNNAVVSFGGKDYRVFKILEKKSTVRCSQEVIKEMRRHHNLYPPVAKKEKMEYQFSNNAFTDYSLKVFNRDISNDSSDKGEMCNFLVMLDLFLTKKYGNLILLTDDKSAQRKAKVLGDVLDIYQIGQVWSSYDVIVHLYLVATPKEQFYFDVAVLALRELNSCKIDFESRTETNKQNKGQLTKIQYDTNIRKIKEKYTKELGENIKRLNAIKSLKNEVSETW